MKWEYMLVADVDQEELNTIGAEGWELVAVGGAVVFKRPLGDPEGDFLKRLEEVICRTIVRCGQPRAACGSS